MSETESSDTSNIYFTPPKFWFAAKAMQLSVHGPRPRGRQWFICLWNADIFYGPLPFLKLVALISWIIAWLT